MSLLRLIARLDIKGKNVVKGIQMEGLRVVGNPSEMAKAYAQEGVELLYIDTVATLYGRNQLYPLLEETTDDVFVPITVAGGIRSLDDVKQLLRCGADAVAINTAALARPALVNEVSDVCGAQAVTVSIEAKRVNGNGGTPCWEAYTDNGRNPSGRDALEWAKEAAERGAGQILLTSVDRDGTMRGFDTALVAAVKPLVSVPVIASGGMGCLAHYASVLKHTKAVAVGAALHYGRVTLEELKQGSLGLAAQDKPWQASAPGVNPAP